MNSDQTVKDLDKAQERVQAAAKIILNKVLEEEKPESSEKMSDIVDQAIEMFKKEYNSHLTEREKEAIILLYSLQTFREILVKEVLVRVIENSLEQFKKS
jgi:hypothetical protein